LELYSEQIELDEEAILIMRLTRITVRLAGKTAKVEVLNVQGKSTGILGAELNVLQVVDLR
jgi:hypothetical protein